MTAKPRHDHKNGPARALTGFFFTLLLMLALLSYHAYRLSSLEMIERIGVIAAEEIIDIQSLMGLFYPEIQALAERQPDKNLVVPGLNIELDVTALEAKDVPEERIGEFIARAIIRKMYYDGFTDTLKPSGYSPANQTEIDRLGTLADTFIGREFNDKMYLLFIVSSALAVLFAVFLFASSKGYYRFTAFGGSFILVGISAIFIAVIRSRAINMMQDNDLAPRIMTEAVLPFLALAQRNYLAVLLSGVGLFLIGRSGMFLTRKKVHGGVGETIGSAGSHHRNP